MHAGRRHGPDELLDQVMGAVLTCWPSPHWWRCSPSPVNERPVLAAECCRGILTRLRTGPPGRVHPGHPLQQPLYNSPQR
jgi:hypothetical protein